MKSNRAAEGGSFAVWFSKELAVEVGRAGHVAAPVLILGESGTGKEVVARAIHNVRAGNRPFVPVDCGSITGTLMESELFGHIRGSFTGADRDKKGLVEEANGGTIFFDEIGELSLDLQVKLLRLLQERKYRPVGSTQWKTVSFRPLFATHRDLERWVELERFRQDLYYRIAVLRIHLKPLRDRAEEIPGLIDHFLRIHSEGREHKMVSSAVVDALCQWQWPGNIRELGNVVERAIAYSSGALITLADLPSEIASSQQWSSAESRVKWTAATTTTPVPLADAEKRHVLTTLSYYKGDRTRTAEALGISRATLFRKLRDYGMQVSE